MQEQKQVYFKNLESFFALCCAGQWCFKSKVQLLNWHEINQQTKPQTPEHLIWITIPKTWTAYPSPGSQGVPNILAVKGQKLEKHYGQITPSQGRQNTHIPQNLERWRLTT